MEDKFNITSAYLIRGFPEYFFTANMTLYRYPHNSGGKDYGLLKIKKQRHNRWLLKNNFYSERQLHHKIYMNPNPRVIVHVKNNPF